MNMKKADSKGFTLLEGLLIVVLLSLVVGVGIYVYGSNIPDKKTVVQNTQSASPTNKVQYSEFKELSVKVPTDQIAGIKSTYMAENQNKSSGYYIFYTEKEREYAVKCFGESGKDSGTISIAKSSGKYGDNPLDKDFNTLVKQYDRFYITSSSSKGSGCDVDRGAYEQMLKEQTNTRKKVEEAFKQSAII